jgi:regulator of replication initiation timing
MEREKKETGGIVPKEAFVELSQLDNALKEAIKHLRELSIELRNLKKQLMTLDSEDEAIREENDRSMINSLYGHNL